MDGHASALVAASDRNREQVRTRRKEISRRPHPGASDRRAHPAEINPIRSEDGGTRSFRFSYSNPPLQQMPSRDEELAPLIRGVFLPEGVWADNDISQQKYRFIVHYAAVQGLRKAKEAAERYRTDLDTDFTSSLPIGPALIARKRRRTSTSPRHSVPV